MAVTFWKIAKESKIEIPEIQRDYAQGRLTERVNTIRKGFVSDLLDAVNSGRLLNLDFIFGQSVDRTNQANFNKNKRSIEQMLEVIKNYSKDTGISFESKVSPKPITSSEDKLLIPFDGQQRLTTLFLLHLYIGVQAKNDISVLSNFNYKTRESSSQFIENIIRNSSVLQLKPDEENRFKLLSNSIKNQSWFFSSWEKDPTVAGILVMLDEIRKQTIEKKVEFEKAWSNLVEKQCVSFDFFDIQEEGFDEDLYVKMNARGKGLTDFENFKAWLEKKHKKTLSDYDWVSKTDKDWLDLFWKTKKEVKDVDTNFLAFFKNIALLVKLGVNNAKSDNNYSLEKKDIELLNPNRYTPTSVYEEENVFNETSLEYIFKILDILASDNDDKLNRAINEVWTGTFKGKAEDTFKRTLLTRFNELSLYHKTFFFSILKFLDSKGNRDINSYSEEDWEKFKDWLRISRNIIYNSRIDDSSAYVPAILAMSRLDKEIVLDIKNALFQISAEEDKGKWISFFNKQQQNEECEKVIFLNDKEDKLKWAELINMAENHFYFYGQIDFIFKLSNSDSLKFEHYLNRLSTLFNKGNVSSKEFILQCIFFAYDSNGTWLKSQGTSRFKFYKSSVANSRDRDENWRNLFNDSEKREVLKSLLDNNDCSLDSIKSFIEEQKK
ncbi:DUF262 domain-containing protein [Flavimarina sp. Hel_I_48]|uniref:GmrSD restriction endonuclease domain-containing protein n=1 Tax=Flavimarina sp. Hel_I_48 TaxID=1392488 RepID=UPI0004DFA840|nr:DUF262 domain-containing protein [Flavimarina sp. Hel_I_48]